MNSVDTPRVGVATTTTGPANSINRNGPEFLARILTEIFAPSVIVGSLPFIAAWRATHDVLSTIGWGLLIGLTGSILPMVIVIWGARKGRWDGHHVRNRSGRLIPFLALIISNSFGLTLLVALDAPWMLIALDISMLLSLLVTFSITHVIRWKISMHAAVAAGSVVILVVGFTNAWLWLLSLIVVAISWSRVKINDHTAAQVIVGSIIGATVGGGIFALLL